MHLRKKSVILVLAVIFCIICAGSVFAQTLVYKNIISGKEFNSESVTTKADNGYAVKITNSSNKTESIFNTDTAFSNLKWKCTNPEEGTDFVAERSGNVIMLSGSFKNKKVEEKYKIDEIAWYQDWGLGLKSFINSDKDSTLFWSIDPNKLRIAKFEAKKEKTEKVPVNGQDIETVYVKANLTGFLKLFWSGEMWFKKTNGTAVIYKMNPKDPKDISQLLEEK
jgi:hypothetical protein